MLRKPTVLLLGVLASLTGSTGSAAADSAGTDPAQDEARLRRLETLLERQQNELAALEDRLAAAQQREENAARTELMRQQIREVLSEQEFRESLMPTALQAGYDNGFYIASSDQQFLMRINGRVQFRWTHYATRADNRYLQPRVQRDDRTGFDVERTRLTFSGHAYSKDLTYLVELRADAPDGYNAVVHYAFLNYRFREELQFQAGIFRLASTRAQMLSDAILQFVDRPPADAVFGFGIGLGARVWGRLFDKRLEYYLDVVNSLNSPGNRTITPDPPELDGNPAILFRTVWHALGEDPSGDFTVQADIPKHKTPALDFGFHYVFNDDQGDQRTTRIPYPAPPGIGRLGGFGLTSTNGLQIHQFGFDSSFKWQGFSATGEYILRIVDPRRAGRAPFTPWWLLTGQGDTTVQHGGYLQCGYFLPIPGLEDKLEAVARVGGISTLANGQEGTWEYAGGLNYYIEGNKVKIQADVTKVSEVPISNPDVTLANVNDDALVFRVQLQVGF